MCGIAGFINVQGNENDTEALLHRMCRVIRHRGPDSQGTWVNKEDEGGHRVALGMRRLSIIDMAGGDQPIFNEDASILVVFNGEIYNYRKLRQELLERGHRFRTLSDTEVIVHAYEQYGDDCVNHLRGMFAFALWDRKRQRLLAARDCFGKKPLNYYWDGQQFIFGSEIKSILEARIPRAINPLALDEYLVYSYVPAPDTLFQGILKLPAAHMLIYERGQVTTRRYWDITFAPTCQDDEETAREHTLALLKEAVRMRLMSEVPLGAFLSGGIDSSVVVGLMSQLMEMGQRVRTFSIGFEEDGYSELPYAHKVAHYFGTDHHEFFVRPDLVSILPQLVWAYDEPFADSSMLPTYYVSKLAREHVTVALTGDGGDEIFGGYTHYARELTMHRIPPLLRFLLGHGSALLPDGIRGKKRLRNLHHDMPMRCVQSNMPFSVGARAAMYSPEYFAQVCEHDPYERQVGLYYAARQLDITARMQYVDVHTYLTDDILVKVDKASMLNSLETRAPLLDRDLAEYVSSLPSTIRTKGGILKYLLKKSVADLLPEEILARPKKGFSVPIEHWFRGELAEYAQTLLASPKARQRGIFNPRFIMQLLKTHASTRLVNHSDAIWNLLCLELWFQVYMDRSPTSSTADQAVSITSKHLEGR